MSKTYKAIESELEDGRRILHVSIQGALLSVLYEQGIFRLTANRPIYVEGMRESEGAA